MQQDRCLLLHFTAQIYIYMGYVVVMEATKLARGSLGYWNHSDGGCFAGKNKQEITVKM